MTDKYLYEHFRINANECDQKQTQISASKLLIQQKNVWDQRSVAKYGAEWWNVLLWTLSNAPAAPNSHSRGHPSRSAYKFIEKDVCNRMTPHTKRLALSYYRAVINNYLHVLLIIMKSSNNSTENYCFKWLSDDCYVHLVYNIMLTRADVPRTHYSRECVLKHKWIGIG